MQSPAWSWLLLLLRRAGKVHLDVSLALLPAAYLHVMLCSVQGYQALGFMSQCQGEQVCGC